MKKGFHITFVSFIISILFPLSSQAQKIEYKDGIKYIFNDKPVWGDNSQVRLEFVQTIGGIDEVDEDYLMFDIFDLDVDTKGNTYILDTGNRRIQKFNKHGKHLTTIGRGGQGPGEFEFPSVINIDSKGNIVVVDGLGGGVMVKILEESGDEIKRFLIKTRINDCFRILGSGNFIIGSGHAAGGGKPDVDWLPLFSVYNKEGSFIRQFGKPQILFSHNSSGEIVYVIEGRAPFEITRDNLIFAAYTGKNCIEAFTESGNVILRSERKINFHETGLRKENGRIEFPNIISTGIGIDSDSRIWVLTVTKQPNKWERLNPVRKDIAEFEIFDPGGILLGKLPLPEDIFRFRIIRDRLFIIGFDRVSVTEYRIVWNSE